MKEFILKLLLFTLVILSIVAAGLLVSRITKPQNLHFALIDKHLLLTNTAAPRIILVGGSNLSFGINSLKIEQELNMPVINTAVHAGMGLKYILDDIKPYVNDYDIVIVAPEYDHFYGDYLWGYDPMVSSIIAIPSNYKFFNNHNWRDMVSSVPKEGVKNIFKFGIGIYKGLRDEQSIGIYDRTSFNDHGDAVAHYMMPSVEFESNPIITPYNDLTIKEILKFKDYLEMKNGKLLMTYPCLNKKSFLLYQAKIDEVEKNLVCAKLITLGNPRRYVFNDSLFFNAKYHLTEEGVEIRTALLIEDIKKTLTKP